MAPLRTRTSSGCPAALTPPQPQQSPAVGRPQGPSLCLHEQSYGNLSQLMGRRLLPHLQSDDLIHVKCGKCEAGAEAAQPLTQSREKLSSPWAQGISQRAVHSAIAPSREPIHVKWLCLCLPGAAAGSVQKREGPPLGLADLRGFVFLPRSYHQAGQSHYPPSTPSSPPATWAL